MSLLAGEALCSSASVSFPGAKQLHLPAVRPKEHRLIDADMHAYTYTCMHERVRLQEEKLRLFLLFPRPQGFL